MRSFFATLAVGLVFVACHRGVDEPDPTKSTTAPGGSTSSAPSSAASSAPSSATSGSNVAPAESASAYAYDPNAPFNRREWKEFTMRIDHEHCETAAKKKNQVMGLADYDKKGTLILSACLMRGNVAWYRCILTADTLEHYNWCSTRYLQQPDDVKKPN